MSSDRLTRLADAIRDRRAELGLSQGDLADRGGPSIVTVGQLERAQIVRPQAATLKRVDVALNWTKGSSARVLAGGEPTVTTENSEGEGEIDRRSVGGETEGPSYVPGVETSAPPATDPELLAEIAEATRRLTALVEKMVGRDRPSA